MVISVKDFKKYLLSADCTARVALAVSGGSDSMCLALLASQVFASERIICLHVDHGLRTSSSAEATWLQEYLVLKGLKTHILQWQHENKPTGNVHNQARIARYNLLIQKCEELSIECLMSAHNLNDQAETFLMRALRGSGAKGLRSISQVCSRSGIQILRPMLSFSREQIVDTLQTSGWEWIEDPSNLDDKYDRAKIRKWMYTMPNRKLAMHRLAQAAENMRRVWHFIEQYTDDWVAVNSRINEAGYIQINLQAFLQLKEEISLRVLNLFINKMKILDKDVRERNLLVILNNTAGGGLDNTILGCHLFLQGNTIYITRELQYIKPAALASKNEIIWDNRFCIKVKKDGLNISPLYLIPKEYRPQILPPDISKRAFKGAPVIHNEDYTQLACPLLEYYRNIDPACIQLQCILE